MLIGIIALWLILGLAGSLYWPLKYRDFMLPHEWRDVFKWMPVHMLCGPFSFLTNFPV